MLPSFALVLDYSKTAARNVMHHMMTNKNRQKGALSLKSGQFTIQDVISLALPDYQPDFKMKVVVK
ncbi:hypothetical protein [Nitrosomonas eutropha]|uniref:hypothetical protein n=1 Tax=Nitrosomonas eutropha TaxID=916 RepID=UPI000941D926|nr:hypothetical protein [Nitrosomonas eutropha]